MKKLLSEEPILKYQDFDKEFILAKDASNVAIGAVLGQLDELGRNPGPEQGGEKLLNYREGSTSHIFGGQTFSRVFT